MNDDDVRTLVSVVIPAHNAEATIGETLTSVRRQSHEELEIIVVDDGSSDRTLKVVSEHGGADQRIRVVSQPNGGVACARNKGMELAQGEFVAFVDADDLWRPTKIERQLRALRAGGPETGLAYTWSAIVDDNGHIIVLNDTANHVGDVFAQLCYGNFVGNGSCALIRKKYLIESGGFDPSLRAMAAQGCEDWKLYLKIAERSHFAVVPDYLTGYRHVSRAMSGDVSQMLRSDALVRSGVLATYPEYKSEITFGRWLYLEWLLRRELRSGHWANCSTVIKELTLCDSNRRRASLGALKLAAKLWMKSRRRSDRARRKFLPVQAGANPSF